jgi:hypothetical protein
MKSSRAYPDWICHNCGTKYCRGLSDSAKRCATYHLGSCDCCGAKNVPVTEPRDYGHFEKWPPTELEGRSPGDLLIDMVLNRFDFYRVQKMMHATDWKWSHTVLENGPKDPNLRVPSVERIKSSARSLLSRLVASPSTGLISTGGLQARIYGYNSASGDFEGLDLKFVFEEADAWFDEDDE